MKSNDSDLREDEICTILSAQPILNLWVPTQSQLTINGVPSKSIFSPMWVKLSSTTTISYSLADSTSISNFPNLTSSSHKHVITNKITKDRSRESMVKIQTLTKNNATINNLTIYVIFHINHPKSTAVINQEQQRGTETTRDNTRMRNPFLINIIVKLDRSPAFPPSIHIPWFTSGDGGVDDDLDRSALIDGGGWESGDDVFWIGGVLRRRRSY